MIYDTTILKSHNGNVIGVNENITQGIKKTKISDDSMNNWSTNDENVIMNTNNNTINTTYNSIDNDSARHNDIHNKEPKVDVIVEVCLSQSSGISYDNIRYEIKKLIENDILALRNGNLMLPSSQVMLESHVRNIRIILPNSINCIPSWRANPFIYVYRLNDDDGATETEDDGTVACLQYTLPSKSFENLWESLYFERDIKDNLLSFVSTAMIFSDAHVNPHIISCNRVVLLHGPPGTGKTSLCKSLAQKLAIRLCDRYSHGQLLEINAHSLFSKWFSESGKLVMKLFDRIQELVEEKDSFVCVLIDEVESLTAARQAAVNGSEPSDAIRVVNALLTQIDKLKQFDNVLILTTSNITDALDLAFVDRADIKAFVGLPGLQARYEIIRSCLIELIRVGIINLDNYQNILLPFQQKNEHPYSIQLNEIATLCDGLSGRFLRKLPFISHASFITNTTTDIETYLNAMKKSIHHEIKQRQIFHRK